MLPTINAIITIISVLALIIVWIISTQRRLMILDENIMNAMNQIGVQLSCRFDILTTLLDLTESFAPEESKELLESIKSKRIAIMARSTPEDVMQQEAVISEALSQITMLADRSHSLTFNQSYIKAMDAVQTFERMMRTSRLIYNDSVTKLNSELSIFPVSMIAGILGFRKKDFLADQRKIHSILNA